MGRRTADDQIGKARQREPARQRAAQNAGIARRHEAGLVLLAGAALAGDHENEAAAAFLREKQEVEQGLLGLMLAHAMKIEPGLDLHRTARQAAGKAGLYGGGTGGFHRPGWRRRHKL